MRRPPDCSNDNSRICSCHFIGGVKAAGPSLFKWSQEKIPYYGVKEEPDEKDVTSTQEAPGRPDHEHCLHTVTVDTRTGGEAVEQTIMHFKEEETTTETKPTVNHSFSDT